ncbi:unnamed protein product, partial [Symbiodinium sp. CCMP2456]
MACPDRCPGPNVPHHCKKVPEPSLREQIAALAATFKKTRSRHVPTINSWMYRRAAPSTPMPAKLGMPPMPSGAAAPVDVSTASAASSKGWEDLQEQTMEAEEQEVTQDLQHYWHDPEDQEAAEEVAEQWHAEKEEKQGRTWRSWADQHEEEYGEDETAEDLHGAEVAEEVLRPRPRQLRQLPSTPLPVTPENSAAAKQLFKAVAGVLNGAYAEVPAACADAVRQWLHTEESLDLVTASDGLALAFQAGAVPIQGLTTLASLQKQIAVECQESLLMNSMAARVCWLAGQLTSGRVPLTEWETFQNLRKALEEAVEGDYLYSAKLEFVKALAVMACSGCHESPLPAKLCQICSGSGLSPCAKCAGSGVYAQPCRRCDGRGLLGRATSCPVCGGKGKKVLGACNACTDGKSGKPCHACDQGRPFCTECAAQRLEERKAEDRAAAQRRQQRTSQARELGPPPAGVTIARASATDLAWLQNLWDERSQDHYHYNYGYSQERGVVAAWSIDNPLLSWRFAERRKDLKRLLRRDPDELDGFHGSAPQNYLSIIQGGFRSDLRGSAVGQVFGSGEYFAKNPAVSVSYCRGGHYMLVCQLLLGEQSLQSSNSDGDHIWVEDSQYYVISQPAQVLPRFLVKFAKDGTQDTELERVLAKGHWSTKKAEDILPVPANRPCTMSRDYATFLWIGFLHAHISDDQLYDDTMAFLQSHAPAYTEGVKVQIVRGKFKKAHAVLKKEMPRELVHRLNRLPFMEDGQQRTICVEDGHGSPEQDCPKYIAKYCRGQNLRFTNPCWCKHPGRETDSARFSLEYVDLCSAKGNEIQSRFMASAPFQNGEPVIVGIRQVKNPLLSRLHEEYRRYLKTRHREEPTARELFHGTNNNIHDILFQHGLQPPSDCNASERCPVSGGKGLSTTLCTNSCKFCTEKHEWDRCHMFGLGIYLADMAQKSHRYVSQPGDGRSGRKQYKMIVCSVLGRAFKVEGHLRTKDGMHDVANVKALVPEELEEMVEPCCAALRRPGRGGAASASDLSS